MSATFEASETVLLDKLNLPPLQKPIYEIKFPVYTIPATYIAWANDRGWCVEKTYGPMPERVAQKKFTNFERLRTLSVEQMADELLDIFAGFYAVEWGTEDVLKWLKQEVEQ